ncbi:MAG: alpha/beta hydrolase [Planctomycetota bacterium]|nr:alpha/beta hydrolase [Planctomycetota bacterium]
MNKKTLKCDEIHLRYFDESNADGTAAGNRQRAIVFLHGFPDNMHSFDRQIPYFLQKGYRVVVPELPGYSKASAFARTDYSFEDLSRELAAFMNNLGLKDVVLVGHDWGALLAMEIMHLAPGMVAKCVSLGQSPYDTMAAGKTLDPADVAVKQFWYKTFFRIQINDYPERVLAFNDYEFIEFLWRTWSPNWKYSPEELESVKKTFRTEGVASAALRYYHLNVNSTKGDGPGYRDFLEAPIPVPLMIIGGKEDKCINVHVYEAYDPASYPNGVEVHLVRAGHFVHREQSAEVNRLIHRFVGK